MWSAVDLSMPSVRATCMPKAATTSSAVDARRTRGARGALDLAGAFGLLASALARAQDLPDRLADAAELQARLTVHREDLEVCLARARCEAATSSCFGRDFSAYRARNTALALAEEITDADAMLDEVARVIRSLRREARTLEHRLAMCASLAVELRPCPERTRALTLIERARAGLKAGAGEADATPGIAYTFMRVEAKQTGHAR
jgi:hypothetical protein